ncbi:uncharacterized protein LOC103390937 [Cynoglossus semilaevis]|uniref:uncharacterized protein LOC103390937 n=1 Tax=Cynoglossus semilaevis TaxID=244447 RepID=UPI0004954095|nr:uncharacterized protein LOC103390937 [Cynoglossus semilaevis]
MEEYDEDIVQMCYVGEPINIEAWQWYYSVVGDKSCPVLDKWRQTVIYRCNGGEDLKAQQLGLSLDPCRAKEQLYLKPITRLLDL